MLLVHPRLIDVHQYGLMLCIRYPYGSIWLNVMQATIWPDDVHHASQYGSNCALFISMARCGASVLCIMNQYGSIQHDSSH